MHLVVYIQMVELSSAYKEYRMYLSRISFLRRECKLRQVDIAELLHTTQEQYSRYENGERDLPLHHLGTLAKFYGVSIDYILELSDERSAYPASETRDSKRLSRLRKERGLTQAQVGEILGVLRNQYGRYDAGTRDIPLKHLIALARFYEVPADYILELTDERTVHARGEGC